MNLRLLVLLLSCFVWLGGCKSIKDITTPGTNWKVVEERALNERLVFETASFSGRVKLHYPEGGMNNLNASYRIDIVKDSMIMIRLIKLIEAARIMITPDSIFIQDRINSELIACDFSIAKETVGLPADFGLLQDILLGEYHPIPEDMVATQRRGSPKILEGDAAGMHFIYELEADIAKLVKLFAQDAAQERSVTLGYSDFAKGPGAWYPQQAAVDVTGADELSVTFTHRKVSFDEEKNIVSFEVPRGYTRTTCR